MITSDTLGLFHTLFSIMSVPTLQNFIVIANGCLLCRRNRISDAILAAGASGIRHHATFYHIFAYAKWSLDEVGIAVFRLIRATGLCDGTALIAIDDTLARKRGPNVFGAGMHHDPLLSSKKKAIVNWGHSWVVLGVIVEFPFRKGHPFCLPILFRLYRNKKTVAKEGGAYKTRPELAVEMLKLLGHAFENRDFHLVADSAYCGKSVLQHLPSNVGMTGRIVMDAALYAMPPKKRGRGRPLKKGRRLASPREMLKGKCRAVRLNIYGRHESSQVSEKTCLWYGSAGGRLLKVVAVNPKTGGRTAQAFFSTDPEASAELVIGQYARRWSIEVAFQDSKGQLGFEEPQGWSEGAVKRTAPMAMLLHSLVWLWFCRREDHQVSLPMRPWYRQKKEICFADVLRELRREILTDHFLSNASTEQDSAKKIEHLIQLAA